MEETDRVGLENDHRSDLNLGPHGHLPVNGIGPYSQLHHSSFSTMAEICNVISFFC